MIRVSQSHWSRARHGRRLEFVPGWYGMQVGDA